MRNQRLQVDQSFRYQRHRFWICFSIAKLKLDVDLIEGGVREWILLKRLTADSDDED